MRLALLSVLCGSLAACSFAAVRSESPAEDTSLPHGDRSVRSEKPRIREYFPETLYWNPELVTDQHGDAAIALRMADSITTWRITATANSVSGELGTAARGLRVFRDFFVDIDFPSALTQHDLVSVPVVVYNYLASPQEVLLQVEQEDWFELKDEPVKRVALEASEVKSVSFKLKVEKVGPQRLTVQARSTDSMDAIRRSVEIVPDGKKVEVVLNDRLSKRIERAFEIPKGAIEGGTKVFAKVYPGALSQVIEGVEGMLGMPHG